MMRLICSGFNFLRQIVKCHGLIDGPEQTVGVKSFKQKSVSGVFLHIQMGDGVMDAAGIVGHRQRAVDGGNHLRQAAGFKTGGHQDKISGTVGQMFQFIAEITNGHALLKL